MDVLGYLRSNAKPLIIMGHSFGSLLGIHVAWALRSAYSYCPYYLVLTGGVPAAERRPTGVSEMDDAKIIKTLVDYGGQEHNIP
jgi:surfactin synthase thioesterase subunit